MKPQHPTTSFSGTSILKSATASAWAATARADLTATLIDHAHCEKKAAASAISMIAAYPEDVELVRSMTVLAAEELSHFREVFELLVARGIALTRDEGDPYVQRLLEHVRQPQKLRKIDRLLISALIEARSCERFEMLCAALSEVGDNEHARLFDRFARGEAGHAAMFVRLAIRHDEAAVLARLDELARIEAEIVTTLPILSRIH